RSNSFWSSTVFKGSHRLITFTASCQCTSYRSGKKRPAFQKHGKKPDCLSSMSNPDLVLITGASGGIGKVLTALLLEAGWRNIVCQYSTRPDGIAEVLSSHGLDPQERLFHADLTDEIQAAELHRRIRSAFGSIYGLV